LECSVGCRNAKNFATNEGIKVICEGLFEGVSSGKVGNLEYVSNPLVLDRDLGSWQKWGKYEGEEVC